MRFPSGQPLWQNGTPHSMQRAPCAASSSTGRSTRNSLRSAARSPGSRYLAPERSIFRNAPSSPIDVALPGHEALAAGRDRLALRVALLLLARPLLKHALVVGREDLDELRAQRVELVEHALADRRAGAAHVLGHQRVELHGVGVVELLELIEHRRVHARAERAV